MVDWLMADDRVTLTGSRFFATSEIVVPSEDTDWDFVIRESDTRYFIVMMTAVARDLNFNVEYVPFSKTEGYTDDSSIGAYHLSSPHESDQADIQIIVKRDDNFDAYIEVFNMMTVEFYDQYIWKSSPRYPKSRESIINHMNTLIDFFKDAPYGYAA